MFTAESVLSPTEHLFYSNGPRKTKNGLWASKEFFQVQYREWPLVSIVTPGKYMIHSQPDTAARTYAHKGT